MKILEDMIRERGKIYPGEILKVDGFLNHNIDVAFISKLGEEFYRLFKDCNVTKIVTIEASGIGIACLCAQYFNVPVLFAKKNKTGNISSDVYSAPIYSYTHAQTYNAVVSKEYLSCDDRILIIDDFLAKGNAMLGLIEMVRQSGAEIVGAGAVIEKVFQGGSKLIRDMGIRVECLASIEKFTEDGLVFAQN